MERAIAIADAPCLRNEEWLRRRRSAEGWDGPLMNAAMLELTDGTVALIDPEDISRVSGYSWSLPRSNGTRHPLATLCSDRGLCDTIYLHRLIANAGPDDIVVHRNRNPLDNRRENLAVMGRQRVPAYVSSVAFDGLPAD